MSVNRNRSTQFFSHRHHAGLLFCWKLRQGLKREGVAIRIRKYVAYFWENYFRPLFREEAQHLLRSVDDVLSRKALDQHREIESLVHQVLNSAAAPKPAILRQLADAVNGHIRFEERELFPHLERVMDETELARIGSALAGKGARAFKDRYPDRFWIKSNVACACKL